MKKLPTDVSSFKIMIESDYQYIDKTRHIYNLITSGSRFFFLSRPRRFGKSLLISTLQQLFSGNKKLFTNLWIGSSNYDWTTYPVIKLDFSKLNATTIEKLESSLSWFLEEIGNSYGIDISSAPSPSIKLDYLVKQLSKKNRVVVLVDEYDSPLLTHINNVELAEKSRDALKVFFTVLKSLDEHLQTVFITGVTKFSKTSLFSGLNNLNDISLKPSAASLLGYTEEEIFTQLAEHVSHFAQTKKIPAAEIMNTMREWYNGYRFSDVDLKVYNPFSVLFYLKDMVCKNFWLESGTPTFLIKILTKQYSNLENLEAVKLSSESLGAIEIDDLPIITLLFQTGYLSISDFDEKTRKYKLDYPNEEVRQSFQDHLSVLLYQTNIQEIESSFSNSITL